MPPFTRGDSHAQQMVAAGCRILVGVVDGRSFANAGHARKGTRRRATGHRCGIFSPPARSQCRRHEGDVVVALVDVGGRPKEARGREGREAGAAGAKESRRSAEEGRCCEEQGRWREAGATCAKASRRRAKKGRRREEEGRSSSADGGRREEVAAVLPRSRRTMQFDCAWWAARSRPSRWLAT